MAGAPGTADEANRLYWSSELSVAEIAQRLDLSRRALYDLVRPFPTTEPCPACGALLGYANRSARDGGRASCPDCAAAAASPGNIAAGSSALAQPSADGHSITGQQERHAGVGDAEGARPPADELGAAAVSFPERRAARAGGEAAPAGTAAVSTAPVAANATAQPDSSLRGRAARLGGVALLGAAVGAAVTLLVARD